MQIDRRRNFESSANRSVNARMRQLFLVVGVFLFLVLAITPKTEARANILEPQKDKTSEAEQTEEKVEKLKIESKTKLDLVKEVETQYKEVKAVADEVAEVKQTLVEEVTAVKSEVETLKAKLAEKQRLEALRIVTIGSFAPNSSGNTYVAGNCTWYAKSKRADLPNRMGNAKHWLRSAKAQGFKTGTLAKKNAIGVNTSGSMGHVVYVEQWYENGTVLVSEMNFTGLYQKSTRVTSASEFSYIYEKP